jgi:hypothetical protein
MAKKDQPYLALYIQDFLTDEKLAECTASSVGVYIKLMCLLHKQEQYGSILLKQKYKQMVKQTGNQISDFASMFACQIFKNLLFDAETVSTGLAELLKEDVIQLDGDLLYQKRMLKDGKISTIRAKTGSEGGKKTQEKIRKKGTDFAKAKFKANVEIENTIENEIDNSYKMEANGFKPGAEMIESLELPELKIGSVVEMVRITQKFDINHLDVIDLWRAFKIQYFTGEKYYATHQDIFSHFINFAKSQKFTDGKKSIAAGGKQSANSRGVEFLANIIKQNTGG